MKNFRILAGFMVVFFVAFICLSAVAHSKDDDDSGSGHKKNGKKLPKHARVLQAQIDVNKALIENIELTPGPKGDKGDPGDSIQGPQGEPGTSSWFDGFGTVETYGSIKIGNDSADCTSANEGTIRYNSTSKTLELCDGTAWTSLSSNSGSPPPFVCGVDQVQDADGNLYNTVLIGTQCWMAENLNVGAMVNGTTTQWNVGTPRKYCYGDNVANCDTYGGLYQWNQAMNFNLSNSVQGLCPQGWRIPSSNHWNQVDAAANSVGIGQALFDATGFNAKKGGYRTLTGGFAGVGSSSKYWSSTDTPLLLDVKKHADISELGGGIGGIADNDIDISTGLSVRCLKN